MHAMNSRSSLNYAHKALCRNRCSSSGGRTTLGNHRRSSRERERRGNGVTPGGRFLGWSTSPDFPVSVAAKQVAAGWGVVDDVFNGERMIFIPVGGSAYVSADNHLYAIWE